VESGDEQGSVLVKTAY